MEFYGVFEGGGVKGAALAGCLAAAEDLDVTFCGFGGASAGSVVSLLASAGYKGEKIGNILKETPFTEFLDDDGSRLRNIKEEIWRINSDLLNGGFWRRLQACRKLGKLAEKYWRNLGIYDGQAFEKKLHELVIRGMEFQGLAGDELEELKNTPGFTFRQFEEWGARPLRIVSSDLVARRACVFDAECTPSESVLSSVRASSSYPFVFKPLNHNGKQLSDGGVASNLPAFLFDKEYRAFRVPTLAFDLVESDGDRQPADELVGFGKHLLGTALEASDNLILEITPGVVHIRVKTPRGIDTLDFDLTAEQRVSLYTSGREATFSQLNNLELIKHARLTGGQLQRELMLLNGPFPVYEAVLSALAREAEDVFNVSGVRSTLLLLTPRNSLMVVYNSGFRPTDADSDLELIENQGIAWRAWSKKMPLAVDLQEAAKNLDEYAFSQEIQAKIPQDRLSLACLAVPAIHTEQETPGKLPPLGVLSIDSSTPLSETGWIDASSGEVAKDLADMLKTWAEVVGRILPLRPQ